MSFSFLRNLVSSILPGAESEASEPEAPQSETAESPQAETYDSSDSFETVDAAELETEAEAVDIEGADIGLIESADVESAETPEIEAAEPAVIEASEIAEIQTTETTEIEASKAAEIQTTEAAEVEVTEAAEIQITEATKAAEMEATKAAQIEATETAEVEATKAADVKTIDVPETLKDCPECVQLAVEEEVLPRASPVRESTEQVTGVQIASVDYVTIEEVIEFFEKQVEPETKEDRILSWMKSHKKELEYFESEETIEEILDKIKEEYASRQRRRKNVLFWEMKDETRKKDKAELAAVLESIGLTLTKDVDFFRIGDKVSDKRRPFKIMFKTFEQAKQVIQKRDVIRKQYKIKVLPDQTDVQRIHFRNLRDEVNRANVNTQYIKYGIKYVDGVAHIVTVSNVPGQPSD